jgi:hypothetical protein
MKKFLFALVAVAFLASCNSTPATTEETKTTGDSTATTTVTTPSVDSTATKADTTKKAHH